MKREDAFYYKHLLLLGFSDGYDERLDCHLKEENPLSDVTLELALCGSDMKKTVSVLHNYCIGQRFDETVSHDKLRLFFKDAYYSDRMSKKEVISAMHRLASNIHGDGYDSKLWDTMFDLDYYLALAEDGVIQREIFDFAFFSYLDNGTPLDPKLIWKNNNKKKPSFIEIIRRLLKRNQ